MEASRGNLFTRDDTFFGVCEGIGEDLRIPSNLLRIGFALGFFFAPFQVLLGYFALGALVLVSRLVFPAPRVKRADRAEAVPASAAGGPVTAGRAQPLPEDQMDLDLLPIAA